MSKKPHARGPARPNSKPDPFSAFIQQGLSAHQRGQLAEAERLYLYVLERNPQHFDALHYLGALKLQLGDYANGIPVIERALVVRPNSPEALSNLAIGLMRTKRHEEALKCLDRALALSPGQAAAHTNRGLVLAALGRHADALQAYERALKLVPGQVEGHTNRANALRALGRYEESIQASNRALALRPVYPEAMNNKGLAFAAQEKFAEALQCYEQAIAMRPQYAEAWSNRGNALKESGHTEAALASYDEALRLKPDYAEAQYNKGNALGQDNRHVEALQEYDKAISIQADHVGAHWNKALSLLLLGRLREGFSLYEWRWQLSEADKPRQYAFPRWDGTAALKGRRIVLWSEQGLGDTLQFVRYVMAPALREAQIILAIQPALRGLLASLPRAVEIAEHPERIEADFHCPLLSLPGLLGTDGDSVPADLPYLHAEPSRLPHWQTRLGTTKLRVALCCSGSLKLDNDRNRSIPLQQFAPLANVDASLFLMQKDCRQPDLDWLATQNSIIDLHEELDDFRDTAAALASCDLLISVDTSVAHLAAALGKPVWLLLPFAPDWRWQLAREDSPWYPGMRLYRQQTAGDWPSVIARVCRDLQTLATTRT